MAGAKKTELIEIKPIEIEEAKVRIRGTSPLIMHAWSVKAKREILEKELNITKVKGRDKKNPFEDFCSSMYWLTKMPEEFTDEAVGEALEGARFGFPVTAFKQAAISAAYRMGWTKDKMSIRGTFFIKPDADGYYAGDLRISPDHKRIDIIPNVFTPMSLVEIHSDTPVMREDMVVVGGMSRSADVRYRGQFNNWYADLTIQYNKNGQYTIEQILNFINAGGFTNGVGEMRAERDGQYGAFTIEI